MKWREPWAISLKQQARFNLFGRDVVVSAVLWSAALAVLGIVLSLGEDVSVQFERARRLWVAPAVGVPLAVFIYVASWVSPRKIDSGPNGIVIAKGEALQLIPWRAIDGYAFERQAGLNVLRILDGGGGTHLLFLPDSVHPKEVERELTKNTGKHPNSSLKPTPLRGAA